MDKIGCDVCRKLATFIAKSGEDACQICKFYDEKEQQREIEAHPSLDCCLKARAHGVSACAEGITQYFSED